MTHDSPAGCSWGTPREGAAWERGAAGGCGRQAAPVGQAPCSLPCLPCLLPSHDPRPLLRWGAALWGARGGPRGQVLAGPFPSLDPSVSLASQTEEEGGVTELPRG